MARNRNNNAETPETETPETETPETETPETGTPVTETPVTETPVDLASLFGTVQAPAEIPADLVKDRKSYPWGDLAVGGSIYVPLGEAPNARSSAIAFGKGTKGTKNHPAREPRSFASQTVEIGGVKAVRIWRLPNPANA